MKSIFARLPNGKYTLSEVVVVSCGCGDLGPRVRRLLEKSGVTIPIVNSSGSMNAKGYIQQMKLDTAVPSLRKSKHAVLINPFTGQYIDLMNARETPRLLTDILIVASAKK